jgi:hypothetical protein
MNDPREIDVAYADGHWLAVVSESDPIDSPSLMHLITAVQHVCRTKPLSLLSIKTLRRATTTPRRSSLKAAEKSGAFVVWSTECN